MKCMLCEELSFTHICKNCQNNFLKPQIYKRKIQDIDLISFYKYDDIKELLHTKHTELGYYIFNILAKNSFKEFANEFHTKEIYNSIAIDDHTRNGYSHTAILNNSLKTYNIKPQHNKLHAKNRVTYSSQTKAYRLSNPRKFQYKEDKLNNIILVDDIVTTGTTLSEAIKIIGNNNIAFCMSLTDLSKK